MDRPVIFRNGRNCLVGDNPYGHDQQHKEDRKKKTKDWVEGIGGSEQREVVESINARVDNGK